MKSLITLFFLFNSFFSFPQAIKFNVQGTVKNTDHAKFAYISTLSQQIPISSPKVFMVTPIINGKFEFNGTFDLEGKDYQHACVFVDERGNISKEELAFVWVTGRDKNLRLLILEDMKLGVEESDQMKDSKIVEGGKLTKQLDEKSIAIRAGNRKLLEFIKKYPDSPVSFMTVHDNNSIFDLSRKDRYQSMYGLPSELYMLLSKRLKNSKKGIALKKEIDEKLKP